MNPKDTLMGSRLLLTPIGKLMPVALTLLVVLFAPAAAFAKKGTGNPLSLLNGYWTGGGRVTPLKGGAYSVSCRATYKVAGSSVTQNLRCSGGDYKFSTSSNFAYRGGRISGSWTESTYSATGSMSGTARGNSIRASISGDKFSGRMSINVSGSRQTIYIVERDKGSGRYVPVASISLRR
jgi:hypothetical protein